MNRRHNTPSQYAQDNEGLGDPSTAAFDVADRLHSSAIHLLRRLRVHDQASGLTASRLSALSVIVFSGPVRMGDLAAAEQVRPPTMTRTVGELEGRGFVERIPDDSDGRVQRVVATERGVRVLQEGRRRRVEALARQLSLLPPHDQDVLGRAAELLERLTAPESHPPTSTDEMSRAGTGG